MTDIEARIAALRAAETEAQRQKARAEHDRDVQKARRDDALKALQAEFGVTTVSRARALLAVAQDDLEAEVAAAEASLAEARGANEELKS